MDKFTFSAIRKLLYDSLHDLIKKDIAQKDWTILDEKQSATDKSSKSILSVEYEGMVYTVRLEVIEKQNT